MEEWLRWQAAALAIAAAGLWPALALGGGTRSGGAALARPIGLAVLSLAAWLGARAGILPWGDASAFGLTGVLIIAGIGAFAADRRLRRRLFRLRRTLLGTELLFAALFAAITFVFAHDVRASAGERSMNLMWIEAVHRSPSMPPPDPWLAGHTVSYHHLGHFAADLEGRLAGSPPETSFVFGAAFAIATAGAAAGGFALDVAAPRGRRRKLAAAAAVAGGAAAWLFAWPPTVPALGIHGIVMEGAAPPWWASVAIVAYGERIISHIPPHAAVILFPHAYVLASPFLLASAAAATVALAAREPPSWRFWTRRPVALAAAACAAAALTMANGWDAPFALAIPAGAAWTRRLRGGELPLRALLPALSFVLVPAALAALLLVPWAATLGTAGGAVSVEPVGRHAGSALPWIGRWIAPLAMPAAALIAVRAARRPGERGGPAALRAANVAITSCAAALAVWAIVQIASGNLWAFAARDWGGWGLLLLTAVGAAFFAAGSAAAGARRDRAACYCLAGAACVALISFAAELVNFDVTRPEPILYRNNFLRATQWQSWTVAAIAAGAAWSMLAERGLPERPSARRYARALAAVSLCLFLVAPAVAFQQMRSGSPATDAIAHLERDDPGLAAAVSYARERLLPDRHVVVQAACVGGCHSDLFSAGYLAAASGVPAPIGWRTHAGHWHGAEAVAGRSRAVARFYAAPYDPAAADAMRDLGATHVWVGRLEEWSYGPGVRARFGGWPVVLATPGGTLYRFPEAANPERARR